MPTGKNSTLAKSDFGVSSSGTFRPGSTNRQATKAAVSAQRAALGSRHHARPTGPTTSMRGIATSDPRPAEGLAQDPGGAEQQDERQHREGDHVPPALPEDRGAE